MVNDKLFNGFYSGRRVFLTGHTGFKGSWLSLLLNWLGADVYGYALKPNTKPNLYNLLRLDEYVHSYIDDIRNYKQFHAKLKEASPEVVIHLAAQPLVRVSYRNPRETYEVNVMGTVNLLEAVRQVDSVKVVLIITSDKCYENREWIWGYRENDPLGGYDPYSNSKACSELVTSAYRSSYFNFKNDTNSRVYLASARAGNIIGGGDWSTDRIIPDCVRAVMTDTKVMLRSPNAIRPWQHVLEPLSGYLMLAERLFNEGHPYAQGWNFGPNDDDIRNVEWVVKSFYNLWGKGAHYEIDSNAQPHEANYLKLDCSKAKANLGWNPKWKIDKTMDSVVEWYRSWYEHKDLRIVSIKQLCDYFDSI
ncbi:MAG: CDP-glucose 4,6-dehydratase [Bacteroidales bacterium]|nr:CDP-glucose 4,6-dehydratase [Bacteroidales bacterium]